MPIFNLESCKYNARTLAWTIGVLFIVRDRSKLLSAGTGQVFVRSCLLRWRRNNENARSGRALGNQQSVTVLSKPLARYVSLSATVSLRLCPREPPRLRCTCSDHNLPINFLQLNSWRQTSITFARWVVDVPVCVWPNWTLQTYVLTTGYVAAIHRLAAGHADRVYRLFASLLRVPASPWPPAKNASWLDEFSSVAGADGYVAVRNVSTKLSCCLRWQLIRALLFAPCLICRTLEDLR